MRILHGVANKVVRMRSTEKHGIENNNDQFWRTRTLQAITPQLSPSHIEFVS